eukprot:1148404_1
MQFNMNGLWFTVSCLLHITSAIPVGVPVVCQDEDNQGDYWTQSSKKQRSKCQGQYTIRTITSECQSKGNWVETFQDEECNAINACYYCKFEQYEASCVLNEHCNPPARIEPMVVDRGILSNNGIDLSIWQWIEIIGFNVLVSAVTSLCVVALCLKSYYAQKSLPNQREKLSDDEWQGVKCEDEDEDDDDDDV